MILSTPTGRDQFFRLASVTNQGNTLFKVGTAGFSVLSRWESPISRIRIQQVANDDFAASSAINLPLFYKSQVKRESKIRAKTACVNVKVIMTTACHTY